MNTATVVGVGTTASSVSPDPAFTQVIDAELSPQPGTYVTARRRAAWALLLSWLHDNGRIIRTPQSTLYYLFHPAHSLLSIENSEFTSWLAHLTHANRTTGDFAFLYDEIKGYATRFGEPVEALRTSYWDGRLLRVTNFAGRVWVLDGTHDPWLEDNGAGPVVFIDSEKYVPYQPDFDAEPHKYLFIPARVPNWTGGHTEKTWVFATWMLSVFFTEACPDRPILAILGEKGSGKSLGLQMFMRLLYGPKGTVRGSATTIGDFMSEAAAAHIFTIDNFDTLHEWMRDKLAGIVTGMSDSKRKLFTTNDAQDINYRAWPAVTAVTPYTLQRPDLADRSLVLRAARVPDGEFRAKSRYLDESLAIRDQWWGDVLKILNLIVTVLNSPDRFPLPEKFTLRVADWERLGTAISYALGGHDLWRRCIPLQKIEESILLADSDILVEGIEMWLQAYSPGTQNNLNKSVTARQLYNEIRQELFNGGKADSNWPRSVQAFVKRMSGLRDYLVDKFGLEVQGSGAFALYKFTKV